jgi:hypothetical protein
MFYNTINLEGENLKQAREKAETQDEKVLRIFKAHPGIKFPASVIWGYLMNQADEQSQQRPPLTSIRRSINTLIKRGDVIKTGHLTNGIYGKPENNYVLNAKKSDHDC